MYSEMGFLFSKSLASWNNDGNQGNIYQVPIKVKPARPNQDTTQGQTTPTNQGQTSQNATSPTSTTPGKTGESDNKGLLVYKSSDVGDSGTVGVKNVLRTRVYYNDDSNEDPYISLINYFTKANNNAMVLKAADFAYLKDLGVYPINRLWVLRRYPDNCVVPNNLNLWKGGPSPISTVVGWIKDKEDTPMLSVNFNEVWVDQNQMIDKVLTEILRDEFGLKLPAMMSVPGWSQGILFGMLSNMVDAKGNRLTTDFDSLNPPTGDPNVLRIAKMREINSQGLQSSAQWTLETCYEQKYINGIDPGLAMMDIISNLLKMGTSDIKFVLSSANANVQNLIKQLNSTTDVQGWLGLIKGLVDSFLNGVTNFIKEMSQAQGGGATEGGAEGGGSGGTDDNQKSKSAAGMTPLDQGQVGTASGTISNMISNVTNSLLAGTIMKYRWPLKGSIALMTGISTTPWHLTIGNPYSPLINVGNIVVKRVDVKFSNELGFNDMPARIDVSVETEFGRPLGKQELEKMFNNGYKRVYSQKVPGSLTESKEPTVNNNQSSIPAPTALGNKGTQPNSTNTTGTGGGNTTIVGLGSNARSVLTQP